jgi:hypothetical protein
MESKINMSNVGALTAHYLLTQVFNTSDCVSCHKDDNKAEIWGNARDPGEHKDHVLVRKTLVAGRPWELSDNVTVTTEQ